MISRSSRIGLVLLGIACARHQGTLRVYQDCNMAGFCTDVQFRADTGSTVVASESDWPFYGRTPGGDRHSPLRQIDTSNVSQLEVAWRFHTGEGAPMFSTRSPTALEVTPLVFRGTMYLSTPLG